jgi:ketosteroid isomerase-like protein
MRTAIAPLLLVVSIGLPAFAADNSPTTLHTVEEVSQAELLWKSAYENRDKTAIANILAPEYVSIGRGINDRDQVLGGFGRAPEIRKIDFESIKIRIFGDLAIVTGIEHLNRTDGSWQRLFFTRVWHYKSGRWVVLSFQTTPVPER